MGLRHSPESRSRGHPEITDYNLYVYFFPVREETEAPVKNRSILLRPQKATRLQKWQRSKTLRRAAIRALRGPRRNIKASTKDKMASTRIDCRALCMNKAVSYTHLTLPTK